MAPVAGMRIRLFSLIAFGGILVTALAAEPVPIQVGPPPEAFFPEVRVLLEQLATAYNAVQTDTVVSIAPDAPAFLPRTAVREELGDVIFLPGSRFGESALLADYASAGFLAPLSTYIETPEFNRADFFPSVWDAVTVEGTVYAIPLSVRSWAIGVNGGYCEPAEIERHLHDWEVLLEFMETTHVDLDSDGVTDALMSHTGRDAMFLWETLFLAYGGDPNDPNSFQPGSDAWLRASERVKGLVERSPSLFAPRDLTHRRFDSYWQPVQFAHNDGMDPGALPLLRRRNPGWMVMPPPGDAGLPGLDTTLVAVTAGTPERVAAAWGFVAWLTSADVMAMVYPSANLVPLRRSVASLIPDESTRVFVQSLERIRFQRPQLYSDPAIVSLKHLLED